MMKILYYNDLKYSKVKKQFNKVVEFLKNGDFSSAEVKKMQSRGFFRAKLDYENRLLFKFASFNNETYILLLEVIYNHEYNKSRFLRGAKIDESKFVRVNSIAKIPADEKAVLGYVNSKNNKFHLLDKVISFDATQQEILKSKPPLVIIGSAGSGKTALTLETMKSLKGNVLYITLSNYLVENSSKLYYSDNYENTKQEVDFLSFKEYLYTFKIIDGKEVDFITFDSWLQIRKHAFKIKDTYKLFEEFKGVITGFDISKKYLSRKDYLNLGLKQSIYLKDEREKVYDIFEKYLDFLKEEKLYDINIVSHNWLELITPKYDFVVVDEVQDFTNIQLYSILRTLNNSENFVLCGDSNQIVHPNFFSWTNVKRMFYEHSITDGEIKILQTNYRNSVEITDISNKLLNLKNARFGSIDKESTYLIDALEDKHGEVSFYKFDNKVGKKLNTKTVASTKFAVIVMTDLEKIEARKYFKTPLLFSIHEAKGLEYENIILLNFVSNNHKEFNEIIDNVEIADVEKTKISYSRAKDKTDKSLDAYKFYINSLYVGFTRAVENLYILEQNNKHKILNLLGLVESVDVNVKEQKSSIEDWKKEARKLELQGKKQQADEIKKNILGIEKPDWEVYTNDSFIKLQESALDPNNFNKRAKDLLFAYSLLYNKTDVFERLIELKYNKAKNNKAELNTLKRKYYKDYSASNNNGLERKISKYGLEFRDKFNLTPLLAASFFGDDKKISFLLDLGVEPNVEDNNGRNPYRLLLNKIINNISINSDYSSVVPKLITDHVSLKIENKLVKVLNNKGEYFLLNFLMNEQDSLIDLGYGKRNEYCGFSAPNLVDSFDVYTEAILWSYRKKRTYISSILSKNEIDGTNPYNLKIFKRVDRGEYVLNPDMAILSKDKWVNIYDFANIKKIKFHTEQEKLEIKNQQFYNTIIGVIEDDFEFPDGTELKDVKSLLKKYKEDKSIDLSSEYLKMIRKNAKKYLRKKEKEKKQIKEKIIAEKQRIFENNEELRLKKERDEEIKNQTQLNLFD